MKKNIEELKKLNTRNLLRFYKAERNRFYNSGYYCNCGCGELIWVVHPLYKDMERRYYEHKSFLNSIKIELDTRSHISKK